MGLDAVYGAPLAGHDVVPVPSDLAGLFAAAHRRVTGRPAGAHDGTGAVVAANDPPVRPAEDVDVVVAALAAARRPIVLAGPSVVREHAVDGLRALATAGSLGVLNTWGAKGVFEWRSPHHLATAGLQARDFELGGLADADLIVATGIDEAEARGEWRLAPVVEVAPGDLAALATRWGRPAQAIDAPPLRTELARLTQDGWAVETAPLPPTRVTLHYSEVLGVDGLVVADPGVAGYWVARTYPTSGLGGAIVPAEAGRPGLSAACAVVARLVDPSRPVLCALDGRSAVDVDDATTTADAGEGHLIDRVSARVLDAGRSLGVTVAVEVWADGGDPLDAAAHHTRLAVLTATGGVVGIATAASQLIRMVDVAGPVVAWGGLSVTMEGS